MKRLAAVVVGAVLLAGCTQGAYGTSHGIKDAPIGVTDNKPAKITDFPDGYANVAFKCIGKVGVYVTTRDAAPGLVLNDPSCP